jgi:hypothetical protein
MAHRTLVVAACCATLTGWLSGVGRPTVAQPDGGLDTVVDVSPHTPIPRSAVRYYKDKCLVCHGVKGKGDGEGSKELDPKPRSFADKEWQKSASDQKIRDATVKGGPAVGLSEAMPAFPDLEGDEENLNGLVALIRAFGMLAE